MVRRVAAAAAIAFIAACGHPQTTAGGAGSGTATGSGSGSGTGSGVVTDEASAKAEVGHEVDVQGTARDAKLAAAILAHGQVIYCLGLDEWPDAVSGKDIVAHGKLELTDEFTVKPGEAKAGTNGPVYVLRACQYKPL